MPRLLKAAELAEQRSDCITVVRGELAQDRSKPGVPVFRIVCRNEQRLTYAMHTRADEDGGTSLDDSGPKSRFKRDWVQPIDEERGWRICLSGTRSKVAALIKPQIITEPRPRPDINKLGESYFYINLDAEAISGDALKFAAMCKVLPSGQFDVTVAGRNRVMTMRKQKQQGEVPAIPVDESDAMAEGKMPKAHTKGIKANGIKANGIKANGIKAKSMGSKASAKVSTKASNSRKLSTETAKNTESKSISKVAREKKQQATKVNGFKTEQGSRAGWQRIVPDMSAESEPAKQLDADGWEVESAAEKSNNKPAKQAVPKLNAASESPSKANKLERVAKQTTADGWQVETSEAKNLAKPEPQRKTELPPKTTEAKTADGWTIE